MYLTTHSKADDITITQQSKTKPLHILWNILYVGYAGPMWVCEQYVGPLSPSWQCSSQLIPCGVKPLSHNPQHISPVYVTWAAKEVYECVNTHASLQMVQLEGLSPEMIKAAGRPCCLGTESIQFIFFPIFAYHYHHDARLFTGLGHM